MLEVLVNTPEDKSVICDWLSCFSVSSEALTVDLCLWRWTVGALTMFDLAFT